MVSDHIKRRHQVVLTLDRNQPTHRFTQSLGLNVDIISALDIDYQIQSVPMSCSSLVISFENILRFRLELVLEQ